MEGAVTEDTAFVMGTANMPRRSFISILCMRPYTSDKANTPQQQSPAWTQNAALRSPILSNTYIYVTSCAHAAQIESTCIFQGTQPPTLGLVSLTDLVRHWINTCQSATHLWEAQEKLPLVSFLASSPVPHFLKRNP